MENDADRKRRLERANVEFKAICVGIVVSAVSLALAFFLGAGVFLIWAN